MCPHTHRPVTVSQLLAYFGSGCQDTQKGQSPVLLGPGQRHDHRHHDPAQPWTAHRPLAAGERAVAVMPTFADLGSPTPFERFVDHYIHTASCLNKGLHDE